MSGVMQIGKCPYTAPRGAAKKYYKRQMRRLRRRLEKKDPEYVPRILYKGWS